MPVPPPSRSTDKKEHTMADENEVHLFPDDRGRFGDFGGKFIPETLMAAVADLDDAYQTAKANPDF